MILDQILAYKKEELTYFKSRVRLEELKALARDAASCRPFVRELATSSKPFAIIAEIKRRSPSKGLLRADFDPVKIACDYARHGATAISVLTDEHFFGGCLNDLRQVRQAVDLPLLRKDFVWEAYQIYEAREAGADAVLLIAAMLETSQMQDLHGLAQELGLAVLCEIHTAAECEKILPLRPALVGINNRDLHTFKVDLEITETLLTRLPADVLKVSESGIDSVQTLTRLRQQGAQAFLLGEVFMKAKDPGQQLRSLLTSTFS